MANLLPNLLPLIDTTSVLTVEHNKDVEDKDAPDETKPEPRLSFGTYLITALKTYALPTQASSVMTLNELDIWVAPKKTIRANYLIKYQTDNTAYALSFGFLGVDSKQDNLMGTALWATNTTGRTSTVYSFMTGNPLFYTNTANGPADSEVPFKGIDDPGIFNSLSIDIEYFNGGESNKTLRLEARRDLYLYSGVKQQVLPGSSVEFRYF